MINHNRHKQTFLFDVIVEVCGGLSVESKSGGKSIISTEMPKILLDIRTISALGVSVDIGGWMIPTISNCPRENAKHMANNNRILRIDLQYQRGEMSLYSKTITNA